MYYFSHFLADCAPKTDENHPGFSSKTRRSLFRAAINEIEDAFKLLSADADLLDRAERRDLPTAHQELIAQSRSNTSLNTSTEMIFSDMDNFMNWNTSSSFENIPEGGSRQRTPSSRRSGVPDKTKDDMVYRICRDNNKVVGKIFFISGLSGYENFEKSPVKKKKYEK